MRQLTSNQFRLTWEHIRSRRTYWAVGGIVGAAIVVAAVLALRAGSASGHPDSPDGASSVTSVPEVHVVRAERRELNCTVEQPGFVQAYEQTAIYSKVSGFIKAFHVDIGDEIHKGQVLAEIFVPELDEQHQQMERQVELDEKLVKQAKQLIVVAARTVDNADAQLAEARANVGKDDADIVRWQSEVGRLRRMVDEKVVDRDILTETERQLASSLAAKTASEATVRARDAERLTAEANLEKAKIDVETAEAKVKVAEAEARKSQAMLDYTQIKAPYDGVVTVRNANTGDYVQAASGDKSNMNPSAIFVVENTDTLRIFFDIPERYAPYVQPHKTKAAVRTNALSGIEIPATVTRASWSIREKTRTLWTEIDLTKKEYDGLRPGMYVTVSLCIHRPPVFALPEQALKVEGNQTYCFLVSGGKAVKTPVDMALSDGKWVEVHKMKIDDPWVNVTGEEQVIVGDISELSDGQTVKLAAAPATGNM